jgi:predicted ATPase/DNA-binding XRE family transcriptional regulator
VESGAPRSFGAQLKSLREAAGFTQEELATIAGLSVHAISALERGQRRRPQVDTLRALSAALDLTGTTRDALIGSARAPADNAPVDQLRDFSLPLALTVLVGRDGDVQTLRLWLSDPTVRLITLTGPGGAGKTRLALELAHAKATEGARVLFVGLAAVRDAAFVAPAIAEALGVVDATTLDLPRRVRALCDGTPTLLVLDNFEQVLDAAPLLADLLASVAALRVLVTSRAPLHLRGEREYAVGPLALDTEVDATSPTDLARSPAVRLFVERVRDVQPDFHLTAANGPAVKEICRRLDALPLALELAAPWLKVLSAEGLCERLARDVLLSTAGSRDLPERQQTMNATVAWSYQLLGAGEQRVFRRLGALPGSFPIEAAVAVVAGREATRANSDEVLGLAAGLIDRSLLLRAKNSASNRPLFQMLETVRAYAALELTAAGERDDAMEGLVRYCAAEASMAAEGLVGRAQGEWLDRVRDDLESYRGALTWLIDRDRLAEASDIAWSLFFFWGIRGHTTEGMRWYDQILDRPSLPPAVESRSLIGRAAMRYTQGQLGHARAELTRALALSHATEDSLMVARAENMLGDIEHAMGNVDTAREHFARGVEGFRALALPWGLGNSLTGMAGVVLASGDQVQAEQLLDEATTVLRHTAPWFLSWTLYLRALLAVRRGNADEAITFVRESLTYIRELRDKFAFVCALVPLAAAAVMMGDDAWAARILGAADSATERTGAAVPDRAVQDLREQTERQGRARFGPDRWARSYAAGRIASTESLIKDIDHLLKSRGAAPNTP